MRLTRAGLVCSGRSRRRAKRGSQNGSRRETMHSRRETLRRELWYEARGKRTWIHSKAGSRLYVLGRAAPCPNSRSRLALRFVVTYNHTSIMSVSSKSQCHRWNRSGSLSPARRVDLEGVAWREVVPPDVSPIYVRASPPNDGGRSRRRPLQPTYSETFRALLASTSVGRGVGMRAQ